MYVRKKEMDEVSTDGRDRKGIIEEVKGGGWKKGGGGGVKGGERTKEVRIC